MTRYRITYDNGHAETITAASVNYDPDESQYLLVDEHDRRVAFIPDRNVLSIHRQDDDPSTTTTYPYQDGDVIALGPEVFASADGETISWKGANYNRRPYPSLGAVTG